MISSCSHLYYLFLYCLFLLLFSHFVCSLLPLLFCFWLACSAMLAHMMLQARTYCVGREIKNFHGQKYSQIHHCNVVVKYMCGSPGQKSNIIPSRISSASPSLTRCSAKLPLGAGLICASWMLQIFMRLHTAYELHPQRKFSAIARQTQRCARNT